MCGARPRLCVKGGAGVPLPVTLPALLNSFRPGKTSVWAKVTSQVQAVRQPVKHSLWLVSVSLSCLWVAILGLGSGYSAWFT